MKKELFASLTVFITIICTSCIRQTPFTPATVPLDQAQIGDYVLFGKYEQDNDTANGKEDIEWLVIDKAGDELFLVSKYVLDSQPYNTVFEQTTWEDCSLRAWLNDSFINEAFSAEEQKKIEDTKNMAEYSEKYGMFIGHDTTDKVFLLSMAETGIYFSSAEQLQCSPTAYAVAQGINVYEKDNHVWWWLRSTGGTRKRAANVEHAGIADSNGGDVNGDIIGVRPALWIDFGQ